MKRLAFLSFLSLAVTLFAANKPDGLNMVVQDLVLGEKTDQGSHPVKKLKQKLANETPSGESSLHVKVASDLAEKEKIKKTEQDRICQKTSLERSLKK